MASEPNRKNEEPQTQQRLPHPERCIVNNNAEANDSASERPQPQENAEHLIWYARFGRWLKAIIEEPNAFATTLATIVIAAFTVELYCVSNRQWQTMQRQMKDSEAVQRAHLVILEPFSVEKGSPSGKGWWLTNIPFQVKNVGQTVANEIGLGAVGACDTDPITARGPAPIHIPAQPNPSGGSIAAGETRSYKGNFLLTQNCINGLTNGTTYAWVQINVSYRDVFGMPQVIADSSCYVPQHRNWASCAQGHIY